jgi:hypothetical protein
MSDTRDPETDQVAPTPNDEPYVQDILIGDIEERKQHGIRKYGTALQVGNGRSMMLDAYEEVLDLAVYLCGVMEEEKKRKIYKTEPDEPGFYKYTGGGQVMIFLLINSRYSGKQWYAVSDSGTMDKCVWGYIEQALSVWDLEKI